MIGIAAQPLNDFKIDRRVSHSTFDGDLHTENIRDLPRSFNNLEVN